MAAAAVEYMPAWYLENQGLSHQPPPDRAVSTSVPVVTQHRTISDYYY